MKPAPFDYYAPETLEQAISLLEELEDKDIDAKILAGGQSFMPMLAMRVARPDALVDLGKLPALDYINEDSGTIAIGAMTSKSDAEDSVLIQEKQPLFHAATRLIGHRQIRNRGSVGGSFAHADPAAEYPAVALVLDMEMRAMGPDGERSIAAEDFFVTYMTSDLDTTEILIEVRMPVLPTGTGWSIQEMSRRDGDLALAGVAVTLKVENNVCVDVRIAAFGVCATAVRLMDAENAVNGQPPDAAVFEQAGMAAAEALDEPLSDIHASAPYRRDLVKTLVARTLAEAKARVE